MNRCATESQSWHPQLPQGSRPSRWLSCQLRTWSCFVQQPCLAGDFGAMVGHRSRPCKAYRSPGPAEPCLRCVLLLCCSQPALLNSVCVWRDGAGSCFPSVLPSLFPAGLVCNHFAEYAAREWEQWGISSLLFRLTCSPSLQEWLAKLLSSWLCSLESSRGIITGPRRQAGNKLEWKWILSASQCQNGGSAKGCHCGSLWANHPTSSSPREEKRNISTASAEQLCSCHAPSLTLCKLEHALSKGRDDPKPAAWIDHPKLPWVFHVQQHWVQACPKLTLP